MSATLQRKSNIVPTSREDIGDDPLEIRAVIAAIDEFSELEDDYDAMDGLAPSFGTLDSGKMVVRQAFEACSVSESTWLQPLISLAPDGNIHLEWRIGVNILSVITNSMPGVTGPFQYKCSYKLGGSVPVRLIHGVSETAQRINSFLSLI